MNVRNIASLLWDRNAALFAPVPSIQLKLGKQPVDAAGCNFRIILRKNAANPAFVSLTDFGVYPLFWLCFPVVKQAI
jgi:hypothetical protein